MVGDDNVGWKGASVSRRGGPFESPFERLRTGPSRGSGQALREAQDRPFERLRTGSGRAGSEIPVFTRMTGWGGGTTVRRDGGPSMSLRASGTQSPPVHPSRGSGRAVAGSPRCSPFGRLRASGSRSGPSRGLRASGTRSPSGSPFEAGSGQALREPQGEAVGSGSPFGRLRPGPSRGSGRAEPSSFRFTLRQAQGRPFERLRAGPSSRLRAGPSRGSGQALREAQGERRAYVEAARWSPCAGLTWVVGWLRHIFSSGIIPS